MTENVIGKPSSFGGRFLPDFFGSLGAWLIGLFATFVPCFINPRFYFNDDQQNQYYAYFIDIGQHLRHGQWPGITLSTFYGSNLIDDWQYQLFNPFSLLMCWAICPMQNLLLVGLFIYGVYLSLLSLGGYCLGRVFGLSRPFSLTLTGCLVMNNFIQYNLCDSWVPGMVSFTWFIWTWVLLEQYRQRGHWTVLMGVTCLIYLTITSGWPHTMLMLGMLMLGYLAELIFIQGLWSRALKLFVVNLGALMATAPFLLPALLSYSWMLRPTGIRSSGLLMPELGSVLNLSSIFFFPRIHLFWHDHAFYPMMYLGWFILPLLPILYWPKGVEALRSRLGIIIFASLALFMLFGPESLGPIRWPVRFLPFVHTAVLLAFFLVISSSDIFRISKARLAAVMAILFIQFTSSVSAYPETFYVQLISLGSSIILVTIALKFIQHRNMPALGFFMLVGMVLFFPLTHLISPNNVDLVDYNASTQNNSATPTVMRPFSGYQLLIAPKIEDNTQDVRFAAEGIYTGTYAINGYSSLGHVGLIPKLDSHVWFDLPKASDMNFLLSQEPTTRRSMLSLMRVNRLLIFNDYLEHALPLLDHEWTPVSKGAYATVLENATADRTETTLSFASDGIVAKPQGAVTGERERLQISSNPNGGQLVFARLYWPGYEAQLNGRPVIVSPLDKLFVKIDLPPGAQGQLDLFFVPPGFKLGLVLATLGSVLCCAAFFIGTRETKTLTA